MTFIFLILPSLPAIKPQDAASVSAASTVGFDFKNSMSESVLRNFASRAVTLAGLCVEGLDEDPIFEDDLRMIQRIGAKFIGRSAYYSWSGNLSKEQIEKHYSLARIKAEAVHRADPEIILQAGVFEIIYRDTVNNTTIPAHVFTAFGLPVETRNFRWGDMLFPESNKYYTGFWGNPDSAVPYILNMETRLYFYYCITRYIDAGYESIHLGQAEMMMDYAGNGVSGGWDQVTTLARAYARDHARRGVVLFDSHTAINSGGIKAGDRLVMDIQAAALVPNETEKTGGVMMCEIRDYRENWLQWIGRTSGGRHPLGFAIDNNITILEFDNYGGNNNPGVATKQAFFNWGYDDITWFALQPEWYRNQFLLECDRYLKTHDLDASGRQVYFLQLPCRRVITAKPDYPVLTYDPGKDTNVQFVFAYAALEKTLLQYHVSGNYYTLTVTKDYRANRKGDGCPNGFNQEDTMRRIFLGENAPENPAYTKVVLPPAYAGESQSPAPSSSYPQTEPGNGTISSTNSIKTSASGFSGSGASADADENETNQTKSNDYSNSNLPEASSPSISSDESRGLASKGYPSMLVIVIASLGVLILLSGLGYGFFLWNRKKQKNRLHDIENKQI